jgi:hypothetical protein
MIIFDYNGVVIQIAAIQPRPGSDGVFERSVSIQEDAFLGALCLIGTCIYVFIFFDIESEIYKSRTVSFLLPEKTIHFSQHLLDCAVQLFLHLAIGI